MSLLKMAHGFVMRDPNGSVEVLFYYVQALS